MMEQFGMIAPPTRREQDWAQCCTSARYQDRTGTGLGRCPALHLGTASAGPRIVLRAAYDGTGLDTEHDQ